MRPLPRELLLAVQPQGPPVYNDWSKPIQVGMGGCPWRVAVCSMLLCRAKRQQMVAPLQTLLTLWPDAMTMTRADTAVLEAVVRPCGFHRNRARYLQRFSSEWLAEWWTELRQLTGVGPYVADAVGLFCFGFTDLETNDPALVPYAKGLLQGVSA